jgi:hypothetical protein
VNKSFFRILTKLKTIEQASLKFIEKRSMFALSFKNYLLIELTNHTVGIDRVLSLMGLP